MCVCACLCVPLPKEMSRLIYSPPRCPFLVWGANSHLVFELLIGDGIQELRLREKKMGLLPITPTHPSSSVGIPQGAGVQGVISLKAWGAQGFG